jgi:hypothetical protein
MIEVQSYYALGVKEYPLGLLTGFSQSYYNRKYRLFDGAVIVERGDTLFWDLIDPSVDFWRNMGENPKDDLVRFRLKYALQFIYIENQKVAIRIRGVQDWEFEKLSNEPDGKLITPGPMVLFQKFSGVLPEGYGKAIAPISLQGINSTRRSERGIIKEINLDDEIASGKCYRALIELNPRTHVDHPSALIVFNQYYDSLDASGSLSEKFSAEFVATLKVGQSVQLEVVIDRDCPIVVSLT